MKPTFFITGTDTGVGKTVLTTLLAAYLRERGVKVAALKPLCSGGRTDAEKIFTALGGLLTLDEINPWHFRAALAPALAAKQEKKTITRAQVLAHIHAIRGKFEVTLIEGAGGLLSPLGKDFDSRDLIRALHTAPIVVAANKLGVMNHLRLTLAALSETYQARAKIVLMSPAKSDAATATNKQLLAEFFPTEKIFTLPWLGKKFSLVTALKIPRVRRTLEELL